MKKLFKAMLLGCTIAGVGETTAWVTARTEQEAKDMLAYWEPYARNVRVLKVEKANAEETECGMELAERMSRPEEPVDAEAAYEEICGEIADKVLA